MAAGRVSMKQPARFGVVAMIAATFASPAWAEDATFASMLEAAKGKILAKDYRGAEKALDEAKLLAPQSATLIQSGDLSRLLFYRGVAEWYGGDRDKGALDAWRAAAVLNPDYQPDASVLPESEAQDAFYAVSSEVKGYAESPLNVPEDTGDATLFIDGTRKEPGEAVHVGEHFVQVRCGEGNVVGSWYTYGVAPPDYLVLCTGGAYPGVKVKVVKTDTKTESKAEAKARAAAEAAAALAAEKVVAEARAKADAEAAAKIAAEKAAADAAKVAVDKAAADAAKVVADKAAAEAAKVAAEAAKVAADKAAADAAKVAAEKAAADAAKVAADKAAADAAKVAADKASVEAAKVAAAADAAKVAADKAAASAMKAAADKAAADAAKVAADKAAADAAKVAADKATAEAAKVAADKAAEDAAKVAAEKAAAEAAKGAADKAAAEAAKLAADKAAAEAAKVAAEKAANEAAQSALDKANAAVAAKLAADKAAADQEAADKLAAEKSANAALAAEEKAAEKAAARQTRELKGGDKGSSTVSYVLMGGGGALVASGLAVNFAVVNSAWADGQAAKDDPSSVTPAEAQDIQAKFNGGKVGTIVLCTAGLVSVGTGVVLGPLQTMLTLSPTGIGLHGVW